MKTAKLEVIALANYADFSKDGKLSIIAIFDEIYSNKFPTNFARGFIVSTVSGLDQNKNLPIVVSIKSASGTKVLEQKIELKVGQNGKANLVAELVGLPLPEDGVYTISLLLEGVELGTTAFTARKRNINEVKEFKPRRATN